LTTAKLMLSQSE